jgi:hypothetical protein
VHVDVVKGKGLHLTLTLQVKGAINGRAGPPGNERVQGLRGTRRGYLMTDLI